MISREYHTILKTRKHTKKKKNSSWITCPDWHELSSLCSCYTKAMTFHSFSPHSLTSITLIYSLRFHRRRNCIIFASFEMTVLILAIVRALARMRKAPPLASSYSTRPQHPTFSTICIKMIRTASRQASEHFRFILLFCWLLPRTLRMYLLFSNSPLLSSYVFYCLFLWFRVCSSAFVAVASFFIPSNLICCGHWSHGLDS